MCGGGWVFPRLQCPFCGHQTAKDLVRLDAEEKEEGYFISACEQCHGYIKELDRGRPSVALSPEEEEAVERAMASS